MAFDPWHIQISQHALARYAERRGQGHPTPATVESMRDVLARCAHQNPPLRVQGQRTGRTYRHGDLTFIVSANQTCVVTCYPQSMRPQDKKKRQKLVHRAARERARA
jgi:hypothetical protein